MPGIVLTPEKFFDLFVLCLSWQWDDGSMNTCLTTVDKVVRILNGLGIITDKQRRVLYKDRRTQSLFVMRSRVITAAIDSSETKFGFRREEFLAAPQRLLVYCGFTEDLNRERLLRDRHTVLTRKGVEYAKSIEARYANIITMESYAAEIERQGFAEDKAMGAIMMRYRAQVSRETASRNDAA